MKQVYPCNEYKKKLRITKYESSTEQNANWTYVAIQKLNIVVDVSLHFIHKNCITTLHEKLPY